MNKTQIPQFREQLAIALISIVRSGGNNNTDHRVDELLAVFEKIARQVAQEEVELFKVSLQKELREKVEEANSGKKHTDAMRRRGL